MQRHVAAVRAGHIKPPIYCQFNFNKINFKKQTNLTVIFKNSRYFQAVRFSHLHEAGSE